VLYLRPVETVFFDRDIVGTRSKVQENEVPIIFAGDRCRNIRRFLPGYDLSAWHDRAGRIRHGAFDASSSRSRSRLRERGILEEEKRA